MKSVTPILAAAIVALGIAMPSLAQKQGIGQYQPPRTPETVYAQTCGYCHGRNVGPVLLGRHIPTIGTKDIVRHGLNGMPAFRSTEITTAELDALANWVERSGPRTEDHGQ